MEQQSTRRTVLLAGLGLSLAGCGGGGDGPAPVAGEPAVQRLEAGEAWVGDTVQITAVFSGGQGRIEPDIGPVQSGIPVRTPALAAARRYTLVVEAVGRSSARRELEVRPAYRDRYVAIDGAPALLQYHAAATAADGSVLVIGGSRGLSTSSEAIDRYDPSTRRFARIGSLYTGRTLHTATRLADGRILVLGGTVGLSSGGFAELIDPSNGIAEPAGWPARLRIRHAAVALDDGRVLVVGGYQSDSVELWDPATRRFRLVADRMANAREFPTATRLVDGRVLIVGGDHVGPAQRLAEIFDPRTERFDRVASPFNEERRSMHSAHALADGRVLVLGGEVRGDAGLEPLDAILAFEPAAQRLAELGRLEQPRSLVRSLLLPDGRVRLFGGQTGVDAASASASAYAPGGAAQPLAAMPAGRAWHTVSALPDSRVLILGGDAADGSAAPGALLYE